MKLESSELKNQIQIGKEYARAKDYDKAEKVFLDILKQHQLADVHNALGLCYADRGDFSAAEYCFQQALKINPNYMEAALNLSVLYNNLGFGKKSKEIYKKLKKYGAAGRGAMDPMLMSRIANLYAEVGDLYNGVGEYREAIYAYKKATELCPDYVDIQTKLAIAYRESGQKAKALEIFTKFKRKASKFSPLWVALGVTHYAAKQLAQAKAAWKTALKIDPKNQSARNYLQLSLNEKARLPKRKAKPTKKKTASKKIKAKSRAR